MQRARPFQSRLPYVLSATTTAVTVRSRGSESAPVPSTLPEKNQAARRVHWPSPYSVSCPSNGAGLCRQTGVVFSRWIAPGYRRSPTSSRAWGSGNQRPCTCRCLQALLVSAPRPPERSHCSRRQEHVALNLLRLGLDRTGAVVPAPHGFSRQRETFPIACVDHGAPRRFHVRRLASYWRHFPPTPSTCQGRVESPENRRIERPYPTAGGADSPFGTSPARRFSLRR